MPTYWIFYYTSAYVGAIRRSVTGPLGNSADPNEIPHYVAFHLGLHCLPKYLFRDFLSLKDDDR